MCIIVLKKIPLCVPESYIKFNKLSQWLDSCIILYDTVLYHNFIDLHLTKVLFLPKPNHAFQNMEPVPWLLGDYNEL